jgi:prepilin-type N-terminal cleavage/methylation domain-containing protein
MRLNRIRKYISSKKGLSFIEILITLLILSICIIPLMKMFTTAMNESNYIDDMLTSLDLAREEAEKVKNCALTKEQIQKLGNVLSPPIYLNRKVWRTARVVNPDKDPLEVYIYVFQGDDFRHSLVTLATIVNK